MYLYFPTKVGVDELQSEGINKFNMMVKVANPYAQNFILKRVRHRNSGHKLTIIMMHDI